MTAMMQPGRREDLLTTVEKTRRVQAKVDLTRREKAALVLRRAVRDSDIKLDTIGDHGQISRQIDDKENLSFHHMFATWPAEVWCELIPLLALEFGQEVVVKRVIELKEKRV